MLTYLLIVKTKNEPKLLYSDNDAGRLLLWLLIGVLCILVISIPTAVRIVRLPIHRRFVTAALTAAEILHTASILGLWTLERLEFFFENVCLS